MPFLPFIPFADCIDVFWDFIQQGVPWAVTMTVQAPTAVTPTVLVNVAGALDGWWTTDMSPNISSNVTLRDIKLTDLTTQTGPVFHQTPTTSAGSLSGSVLPAQTALVVSLQTVNRGRSFRGRNYWAGRVFADQNTVTQWNTTRLTAFAAAYSALAAALATQNCNLVVASRFNNGVRRTTGVATFVSASVAKPNIATQRRRLL